jgi:hypothetical protein
MINKNNLISKFLLSAIFLTSLSACKKNNAFIDKDPNTPTYAHFLSSVPDVSGFYNGGIAAPKTYFIHEFNNKPAKLFLGITNVASGNQMIGLTYTSITGAINGTHYTGPQMVTIKPGTSMTTVDINAKYIDYVGGRVDTIKIKIDRSTMPVVFGQDSVVYYISKYCDVVPSDLVGSYDSTKNYANGTITNAYSSSITSLDLDPSSPTKATGNFSGLVYKSATGTEFPLADLIFTMDWTDESNFKIVMDPEQDAFVNGSNSYSVVTSPSKTSSFSSCSKTFVLYLDFINQATGALLYSGYKIVMKQM